MFNRIPSLCCAVTLMAALAADVTGDGARAQEGPSTKAVPLTAEQVLDRYAEALGGKAALDKIDNRVSKAVFEMPAQGIKGDVFIVSARPNLVYSEVEMEGLGKITKGYDGNVAWQTSLMIGPQIMEGSEKSDLIREATFDKSVNWRSIYQQVELGDPTTIDERLCHTVLATPEGAEQQTHYYDQGNGLLVRVDMMVSTASGDIPMESRLSDYREVDGVLLPFKTTMTAMGQERTFTLTEVQHNVKLPPDQFDLPAEIKELVQETTEAVRSSSATAGEP